MTQNEMIALMTAKCYNIECPYCVDYLCKRMATCDTRLDGEYVKVVRCKDCKHSDEYNHCSFVRFYNTENDFCSRGETENGTADI